MMLKNCNKCLLDKDMSCFSKDKNRKDGYYSICKECKKEYRLNNLELVKDIFTTIIFIGLTILVGTTSLYTCRVSQSNILPTDINCFPYTNQVEKPEEIGIDINVFYDADKKEKVSEKIRFPYDDNIK